MEAHGTGGERPTFGALLRRLRLAAGLSQEALAERARMSADGISALERGSRRKPYRETLALLASALALDDEQLRAFEQAAAGPASPRQRSTTVAVGPWPSSGVAALPFSADTFVGREAELAALTDTLERGDIAAICGLGGVGKSTLAREYAIRARGRYSEILWLDAPTEDGIIEGLLGFGAAFVRGLDQRPDRRAAARQVVDGVLNGFEKRVLVVFDNVEEERHLRTWMPRTGAHVLMTSRNDARGAGIASIPLPVWPLETAVEYIRHASDRKDLTETDARAIAETLGALPLALSHAAGSLRTMRMLTPKRYLKHVTAHLNNAPQGTEYPRSVFATFKTAISHAEHEAAGAAAALCFAASFAPDAIPDELFRQPAENYADGLRPVVSESAALDLHSLVADEVRLDAVLGALDRISLLTYSEHSQTYEMHRLVQLAARDVVAGTAEAWGECAVAVVNAAFPEIEFSAWPQCARLLPHARAALDAVPSDTSFLPAGRLTHRCGVYLRDRGEYDAALPVQQRALTILEKALGPHHAEVASTLNRLASLYYLQGRYEAAEALYTRALTIQEKVLSQDHPEVAASLNNLANVCTDQGRYEEAKILYTRALAMKERTLGLNHPAVARTLNTLAVVHWRQTRYEEAELLLSRALAIWEETQGSEHPDFALGLNNLANIYLEREQYEEARALHTRALTIQEKSLGADHPAVAVTLSNIAEDYSGQERFEEMRPLHLRALAIREKAFGPDHTSVASSLRGLAEVSFSQGHYGEAEALFVRGINIQEKALDPYHFEHSTLLCGLAGLYEAQQRVDDAVRLYSRALTIRQKVLGSDHPKIKALREKLKLLAR